MEARKRKWMKKGIAAICLAGVFGMSVLLLCNWYVVKKAQERILTREEAVSLESVQGADCILILGAGVWDGSPSPMLQDRLEEGLALYEAGAAEKILVSGDHGRKVYDEVNVMRQYLVDAGVPEEDVFMDHAGFSTYESMYRARKIFGVEKMVVVTQKYHLYRSLYVAEALGMEAWGVGSDPRSYGGQKRRECRELLARAKDIYYVLTKHQPTYLGDPIDIHGDGSVTVGTADLDFTARAQASVYISI